MRWAGGGERSANQPFDLAVLGAIAIIVGALIGHVRVAPARRLVAVPTEVVTHV
ncbi:MAG TPA: hypothetical protein VJO52_09360 [Gemmatimonadaceae bacterium]|nr:hypothetical protein [Gemmatimonadaceae bacterium]